MDVNGHLYYLQSLINSGGPNRSDYDALSNTAAFLMEIPIEERAKFFDILRPILNVNSMIGHTFLKPYGYPGDFELIYRIYANLKNIYPEYQKWDDFYHWTDTVEAIRKRNNYFADPVNSVNC